MRGPNIEDQWSGSLSDILDNWSGSSLTVWLGWVQMFWINICRFRLLTHVTVGSAQVLVVLFVICMCWWCVCYLQVFSLSMSPGGGRHTWGRWWTAQSTPGPRPDAGENLILQLVFISDDLILCLNLSVFKKPLKPLFSMRVSSLIQDTRSFI